MTFSLSGFSAHRNITPLFLLILFSFAMGQAQAITIDFDDLNPEDFINTVDQDEWLFPLTNEYESLGVMFGGPAYLVGYSRKSLPNYVTGPGFGFYFLGVLPTYVSMYVGSEAGYKVGISAYGVNGLLDYVITDGEVAGMNSDESTPFRHNQFVSFFEPEGIYNIDLSGQAGAYMDDLSFGVPEPGICMLLCIGFLSIYLRLKRC
jgi:hypothetical protein